MITLPVLGLFGRLAHLYARARRWRDRQPLPSRHIRGLSLVLAWMSLFSLGVGEHVSDQVADVPNVELVCRVERRGGAA